MNGNFNNNPPNMTVQQLIAALQALGVPNAFVRLERPNGWDNPIPVIVAGHQYGFTEDGLVTL